MSKARPSNNLKKAPARTRLPGDPDRQEAIRRMIRVDHAGEYGAVRIYEGQLRVLKGSEKRPLIEHMAAQERRHLDAFNALVPEQRVRRGGRGEQS